MGFSQNESSPLINKLLLNNSILGILITGLKKKPFVLSDLPHFLVDIYLRNGNLSTLGIQKVEIIRFHISAGIRLFQSL